MIEAGLTGAVASAVRYRRRAIAMLATADGAAVAGSAASYLYSTGPGKRDLGAAANELPTFMMPSCLSSLDTAAWPARPAHSTCASSPPPGTHSGFRCARSAIMATFGRELGNQWAATPAERQTRCTSPSMRSSATSAMLSARLQIGNPATALLSGPGAKRGANGGRRRATQGGPRRRSMQLDGASGDSQRLFATVRLRLLINGSRFESCRTRERLAPRIARHHQTIPSGIRQTARPCSGALKP
jgi:hypothetical protein